MTVNPSSSSTNQSCPIRENYLSQVQGALNSRQSSLNQAQPNLRATQAAFHRDPNTRGTSSHQRDLAQIMARQYEGLDLRDSSQRNVNQSQDFINGVNSGFQVVDLCPA